MGVVSETGDVIRALQAAGVSIPDQARAIGRDPSFLRQIAAGRKPGAALAGPLERLLQTGRVSGPVARRMTREGELAKVRAPRAAGVPSVRPAPPPRGSAAGTTYLAQGARLTRVDIPPRNRDGARAELRDAIRRAAVAKQRLTFHVETKDGRRLTLGSKGGYQAANRGARRGRGVLAQVRDEGNDPLAWLLDQLDAAGYSVDGLGDLVSVEVSAYR